jgi:hypothetical protein
VVEVAPTESSAHITVHRKGNLRGEVSFNWWTESGTAKLGEDYSSSAPQVEHIGDGQSSVSLIVPLVLGPARPQPKSFYVVIDGAGPGATLGSRTVTMVTIPATE